MSTGRTFAVHSAQRKRSLATFARPEWSSALLFALVLFDPARVIGSKQSGKASEIEEGCLQRLATGQKDLPPVHICRYAAQCPDQLARSTLPDCNHPFDWCFPAARGQTRQETLKPNQLMTAKKQNTRMHSHTAQLEHALSHNQHELIHVAWYAAGLSYGKQKEMLRKLCQQLLARKQSRPVPAASLANALPLLPLSSVDCQYRSAAFRRSFCSCEASNSASGSVAPT